MGLSPTQSIKLSVALQRVDRLSVQSTKSTEGESATQRLLEAKSEPPKTVSEALSRATAHFQNQGSGDL